MGDPLSIVAGAAGIVTLGLTVCSGLLEFYGSWKDSPADIVAMCESLDGLTRTFQLLDQKVRHPLLDHECVERVTESIISCAAGVQKLQSKLDKMRNVKPGSVNAHLQRVQYPFRQKTLDSLVQTISHLRSNLGLATSTLQLDIAITSFHQLHELDRRMRNLVVSTEASHIRVLDGISKLYDNQEQEKLRSISAEERAAIDWLSPLDFAAKQNDAFSRRQHGTGRWLLESPEFRSWLTTAGDVLWCPGIPGAGKTILVSTVIDHLEREHQNAHVGVAYVYCIYNGIHQTAVNLLGSLLRQLAVQNSAMLDDIKSCHKNQRDSRPSLEQISRLLHSQVQKYNTVFIVIDALDECPEAGQVRKHFLAEVRRLRPDVQIMVTSRHLPSIESTFSQDKRLEVRAHEEDVQTFIESRMATRTELSDVLYGHDDVRSIIVATLLKKTHGMFLLAALHIESLSKEDNVRDIRESLQKLPEDLDTIYDEAMQRIKRQDRQKVARADQVLTLINCAYRPLQIQEIQHALSIRPGDTFTDLEALPTVDSLLSACCGLVVVEDESQVVRLVHYTTEEYFNHKNQYRSSTAHLTIAATLLTYLNFTKFATFPLKIRRDAYGRPLDRDEISDWLTGSGESMISECLPDEKEPGIRHLLETCVLLRYAAQHWGDHAREAFEPVAHGDLPSSQLPPMALQRGSADPTWDLKALCLKFLESKANVLCASHAITYYLYHFRGKTNHIGPDSPSLQIVSAFGIHSLVKEYLRQGVNIDEQDPLGYTALHVAAASDHARTVELLVNSGCSVELPDFDGQDAMYHAIVAGSLAAVRFLLKDYSCGKAVSPRYELLMYRAAETGHSAILELLEEHEPVQAARNKCMGRALVVAARYGMEAVVRLILQRKRWTIDQDDLSNALTHAAQYGHLIVTQTLLEDGVDVNSFAKDSYPPLHAAANWGTAAVVLLLLEAGADVNLDHDGDKPLHFAAQNGSGNPADAVDLLLDRGSDVDALNRQNETAILILAKQVFGSEGVVAAMKRLLEHGANTAVRDHQFRRTSLDWSIIQGSEPSVKLLLQYADTDVSQQSAMLLLARIYRAMRVFNFNTNAIDQLVCRESLKSLKFMPELLLLHAPAERGCEGVVRFFLDMGAAVDSEDDYGRTPLHVAVARGRFAIVQLLVAQKVDIDARDKNGKTPLIYAVESGSTTVAEFLLDQGADVDGYRHEAEVDGDRDGLRNSPLPHAAWWGFTDMIKLLVQRGANAKIRVDGSGFRGGTLLHLLASRSGPFVPLRRSSWSLLIDQGVNVESKDSTGNTALVVAVRRGSVDAVRYLLEIGADPRALPRDVTPEPGVITWMALFQLCVELVRKAQSKLLNESTTS